jgi:hypothetical protein
MANENVLKIEEAKTIPEGPHVGVVKDVTVETRIVNPQTKETGKYVDLHVVIDGIPDIVLKTGYPAKVTPKTGLGMLFSRFGVDVSKPGGNADVNIFKGKRIAFETVDETNDRGTFARVTGNSIKPLSK